MEWFYIDDENFNRKVFFVYGGTDTKTRENIREITEKKKMRLSLHHMVHFLLVSISKIYTT